MKRFISLFIVLCMLSSGAIFAAGISVATTRGYATTLNVDCPEITIGETEVLGNKNITVSAVESIASFERGAPTLPLYNAMVMVDPARRPIFQVTSLESEIIEIDAPVVPSKGNFTRDIDPNSVPYVYGEMYEQDAWFPADEDMAIISEPFVLRDVRGVNLMVSPVQYNPVQNKLRVHKRIRITMKSDDQPSKNVLKSSGPISSAFESIYQQTFVNFGQVARRHPRDNKVANLLIISYDDFMKPMAPFIEWKRKLGMTVNMVPMSAIGVTAKDVQAFIQAYYNEHKFTHVMLIGDAEQIPTLKGVREGADSDPSYVKLAGNDHVPDAIISRLTANTKDEVAYQVAKFVNYERFPYTDNTEWYGSALGVASHEGIPTDYVYMGRNHDALLNSMFTKTYEAFDPGATVAMVADAVNSGVSLINYLGHGSGVSWATSRFHNRNIAQLKNGWMLPVIIDIACVNGRFVRYTGFGEAWLRAGNIDNPAGAVAYGGSTTNMEWVPPIHMQAEMNKNFIANEVYNTFGEISFHGVMKALEMYGTSPHGSGIRIAEQWHIFGDGTMIYRSRAPRAVESMNRAERSDDGVTVRVNVVDENGKAVSGARVTAYTEGAEDLRVGYSNNNGEAVLTMPAGMTEGYVTIFHSDIVPVVDQPIEF